MYDLRFSAYSSLYPSLLHAGPSLFSASLQEVFPPFFLRNVHPLTMAVFVMGQLKREKQPKKSVQRYSRHRLLPPSQFLCSVWEGIYGLWSNDQGEQQTSAPPKLIFACLTIGGACRSS